MSSRYVGEAVKTAQHILCGVDVLPYDDLFELMFDRCSPNLDLSQKVVLYPQFRQAVEPALLLQVRKTGLFGVVDGAWTRVAASQMLQKARSRDCLTSEELRLQRLVLGRK